LAILSGCAGVDNAAEEAVEAAETPSPTPTPDQDRDVEITPENQPQSTVVDGVDSDDIGTLSVPISYIDDSARVEAYSNVYWELDILSKMNNDTASIRLQYEAVVRNGPAVDFYLLEQDEYTNYSNGDNFLYVSKGSETDTKLAQIDVTLEEVKNYVFMIDNTTAGEASPPSDSSTADVDVELTVR
jgi:hypothetical protein